MKGIVLAGGTGSRLEPLTRIANKHALPVFDRPMLFYPIATLRECGIGEILVVTGGPFPGDLLRLVGDGSALGVRATFAYQSEPGGIAQALSLAEGWAGNGPVAVILGDNLLEHAPALSVASWAPPGAKVHLCRVRHPQRFGVPRFEGTRLVEILEKPTDPPSEYAVIGLYLYDCTVFDRIRSLKPSGRGELEVTDLNMSYLADGLLEWQIIDGQWRDCGTPEALYLASTLAREMGLERGVE